jgi:hypothetical protein
MHQSKAENSHAGVSTFPPFKKGAQGGFLTGTRFFDSKIFITMATTGEKFI